MKFYLNLWKKNLTRIIFKISHKFSIELNKIQHVRVQFTFTANLLSKQIWDVDNRYKMQIVLKLTVFPILCQKIVLNVTKIQIIRISKPFRGKRSFRGSEAKYFQLSHTKLETHTRRTLHELCAIWIALYLLLPIWKATITL